MTIFDIYHLFEVPAMARRPEPVRKSVRDVLDDLVAGHRDAACAGPAAARKYLERAMAAQVNLPYAVRTVAWDLLAEAQARLGDWEACAESVTRSLAHLGDTETEFPHGYRALLEGLTCFERGIQANTELGRFPEALALADQAIELGLGDHYQAKRDSLEWART